MISPKHATKSKARTATTIMIQPSSLRFLLSEIDCKIDIVVDLSNKSTFTIQWAIKNYLHHSDIVIPLHIYPTSVLYGTDWGAIDVTSKNKNKKGRGLDGIIILVRVFL
ncbi:universal stress protein phos32 [Quercus suber]|uniref:Universal stress protein phos32 n=1 Tax=Quercus suber TaxID=58331 RepID=A0AAW0L593_QUESU